MGPIPWASLKARRRVARASLRVPGAACACVRAPLPAALGWPGCALASLQAMTTIISPLPMAHPDVGVLAQGLLTVFDSLMQASKGKGKRSTPRQRPPAYGHRHRGSIATPARLACFCAHPPAPYDALPSVAAL